jgi:hypothetical protein
MAPIKELKDINIEIFKTIADSGTQIPKTNLFLSPPITVQLGVPIIEMPGCVETHRNAGSSKTVFKDDDNGTLILCTGGVPSYNPLNFTPDEFIYTSPAKVPPYRKPKDAPTQSLPIDAIPPEAAPSSATVVKEPEAIDFNVNPIECPPTSGLKIGQRTANKELIVTGYKLNGDVCEAITEPVPAIQTIAEEYLPAPGAVTTTATIALVATTSALLAKPASDLILKLIKPAVKKVTKKVAALSGKEVIRESVSQRIAAQRERNHALLALKRTLKR